MSHVSRERIARVSSYFHYGLLAHGVRVCVVEIQQYETARDNTRTHLSQIFFH